MNTNAEQAAAYSIVWEGIEITLSHTSNWLNTGYDHLEVRAAERLPITATGYRSHFIPAEDLLQFDNIEELVRAWLDATARSKDWKRHLDESRQPSLF